MNYNNSHFKRKEIDAMVKETEQIIKHQEAVKSFLNSFLESSNFQILPPHHAVFLHLLIKISFNLESTLLLLPLLKQDARQKISINVIYRSVVDDIINLYYLLGFVTKGSENQVSLENELNILHKEFLMSCEGIIYAESAISDYSLDLCKQEPRNSLDVQAWLLEMKNQNPEVYDLQMGVYKRNKALRSSSLSGLKPLLTATNYVNFLSENQKIKFILARGFRRTSVFTYLFKYFSQYQHYSPKMHEFNLSDALLDLRCYRWTLIEVLNAIGEINFRLMFGDWQDRDVELKKLIADILKWL